jgi:protein-S-isoprenylcysteine O-methyltransferase Ste14
MGDSADTRPEGGSRWLAAAGSAIFFAVAPCAVAGLVPWWLTGWHLATPFPLWEPVRVLGAVLTIGATVVLLSAFARFVVEGIGTPAPVAPTQHLVIGGLYRYVRNPMYIAVVSAIMGQAGPIVRPTRSAVVRGRGRRAYGCLRPLDRGTDATGTLWRRVRGVSAGRTWVVAPAPPLATGLVVHQMPNCAVNTS